MENTTESKELPVHIQTACAIAKGEAPASEEWVRVKSARADYNARGSKRAHWYRMFWNGSSWKYYGDERLAPVGSTAKTRNQTAYGELRVGTVIVQHDKRCAIDCAYIVASDNGTGSVEDCDVRRRGGELHITLPDGTVLKFPDPRK